MRKYLLPLALLLTAATWAKEKPPLATQIDAPADKIKATLVGDLARRGFVVDSDTSYQMVFSKETKGGTGFMTQLLLGGAYSDPPRSVITFQLLPAAQSITVILHQEVIVHHAGGTSDRVEVNGKRAEKEGRAYLESLKNYVESHWATEQAQAKKP